MPVIILAALLAQDAAAQAITPGAVQDTLSAPRRMLSPAPAQVMQPVQHPPSEHDPRGRRFRVNAFAMSGNTVFRDRLLKTLVERFVDQELNLHDLQRAADSITAFYHERGYTLARASIPAQRVERGVVTIQIVEGSFGRVGFSGNTRHSNAFLAARTRNFTSGDLVTTQRLETDLLLLNDLPGISAKSVLAPGSEFGSTDADIRIEEKLVNFNLGLNNHGRQETGRNRLETTFALNSPFGWGDQLSVSGSTTEHELVRYWKVGYSLPLNPIGTRLAIGASKAAFDVSGAMAVLGIRGEVDNAELILTHPFMRTRAETHVLSLSVKRTHLTQSALGLTMADDRLTVANATWQTSVVHPDSAITFASLGLSTNFSGSKPDSVFARWEADVSHITPFYQKWDLYLRGNAVYNRERLPDTEKFSVGGPTSVRGYRPSELRGDSGMLVSAELRHPFAIASALGSMRIAVDAGQAVYKAHGYKDSQEKISSIGIGASLFPMRGFVASVDIARPLGGRTASTENKDYRIWVSASASF